MILSTTKKVIAIYRVNSFLLIIGLIFVLGKQAGAEDISSYCFERSVNLREVQQSLSLLLLPRDIVATRVADNCLDIVTSPDRGKLFEKYLAKRYDLKGDPSEQTNTGNEKTAPQECRLELKTTRKSKVDSSRISLGEKNRLNSVSETKDSVSIMEMLLGVGFPSEFEAGIDKLKVTCQLVGNESASLLFSFGSSGEKEKANLSTQIFLKKGEWMNIATIKKDLADKATTLGLPLTEQGQSTEKNETIYELQFK